MLYNHKKIESKWQKEWQKTRLFETKDSVKGKENFYHLVMFAYPSGDLHIGHWYNFAPADVYARFKRMQGHNVMSPMGFDAFGLPAENAAIKHKIHPEKWTLDNIKLMTKQLESMGNSYDWSRLVITCLPDYYIWNQWLFLKLYEKGLAYRKKVFANWCPQCKTVLANEQVTEGNCERCDAVVEQKEIEQWLFKITEYAEKLLDDLDELDWPERTKIMQRNWIGRSEGIEIEFPVINSSLKVKVFTTRPDTIPGATYIVLAPEHPFVKTLSARIRNQNSVQQYLEQTRRKTERERLMGVEAATISENEAEDSMVKRTGLKIGVELKGFKVINPFTKKEISVWISDYVLASYGTGAIMAVPAHDERDFIFAKEFNIPIVQVISEDGKTKELTEAYTGSGTMINSGDLDNLPNTIARDRIVEVVSGVKKINYKLRDWLISRQRYWGTPIPIVYCSTCGIVPVPEKDLPVELPKIKDFTPEGNGKSPLANSEKFVKTTCPKCKGGAERETDTMDTFVDSSWYFIRYTDPKNSSVFADEKKMKAWLPVTMYIGGAEHATGHLIFARFINKFLYDEKLVPSKEPFRTLRHQGIILGPDGQKMSKSRGNVIDPDELVKKFGADSMRLYLCFMSEYHQGSSWNPTGILGVHRFLNKIWKLLKDQRSETEDQKEDVKLEKLLHQTIKKVGEDIEAFKFNTAISALMILVNAIEKNSVSLKFEKWKLVLKLLAPFAPHLTEELWEQLAVRDKKTNSTSSEQAVTSIHLESWPMYSKKLIVEDEIELVIQINGKLRDKVLVSNNITQEEAEKVALESDNVKKQLGGKKPGKVIFVPGRLINLVV